MEYPFPSLFKTSLLLTLQTSSFRSLQSHVLALNRVTVLWVLSSLIFRDYFITWLLDTSILVEWATIFLFSNIPCFTFQFSILEYFSVPLSTDFETSPYWCFHISKYHFDKRLNHFLIGFRKKSNLFSTNSINLLHLRLIFASTFKSRKKLKLILKLSTLSKQNRINIKNMQTFFECKIKT